MKHMKSALLVGVGITAASLGTLGVASAATNTSSNPHDSLVNKIASKFHLDKSEVRAVFDADRAERRDEIKTQRAKDLAQAVTDGKLTQAQADHLTAAWKEIDDLRGDTRPGQQSATIRKEIKAKMEALRTWEKDQNLDLRSIFGQGPGGHKHGRHGMERRHEN